MGRINANPREMDEVAGSIRGLKENIDGAKRNLQSAKNNVNGSWRSKYTAQYIEEVDTVHRNLDKIQDKLEKLARALNDEATRVRRIEEENRKDLID